MADVVVRALDTDARRDDVSLHRRRASAAALGAAARVVSPDVHRRVRLVLRCDADQGAPAAAERAATVDPADRVGRPRCLLDRDSHPRSRVHRAGDAVSWRAGGRSARRAASDRVLSCGSPPAVSSVVCSTRWWRRRCSRRSPSTRWRSRSPVWCACRSSNSATRRQSALDAAAGTCDRHRLSRCSSQPVSVDWRSCRRWRLSAFLRWCSCTARSTTRRDSRSASSACSRRSPIGNAVAPT